MIGQIMADLVSREADQIDRNTFKEERSFRTAITTNDVIEQINKDQQIQKNQHNEESFHIEGNETETEEVDKQQKITTPMIVQEKKRTDYNSDDEGLLNENQDKSILENFSKSSVCSICKSRRPNNECQRKFTYEELEAATEGFSIMYSLSEGEYGPAFKGQLDNKLKIAIKKIQVTSLQEEKVFMSEVQLLTTARHENLIMLLGSCLRESKLLIVYEYACNGSLDQYLSSKVKYVNVKLRTCYYKRGLKSMFMQGKVVDY